MIINRLKAKILALIIATFLLLFFYYFLNSSSTSELAQQPVFGTSTQFSRISFFNSRETKASLEIPETWEGNYRAKESGEEVFFLSIVDPGSPRELFRVKRFAMDKWQEENLGWEFLIEKDKIIFAYKLSTAQNGKDEKNKKYNEMLIQSSEILKRFKVN